MIGTDGERERRMTFDRLERPVGLYFMNALCAANTDTAKNSSFSRAAVDYRQVRVVVTWQYVTSH